MAAIKAGAPIKRSDAAILRRAEKRGRSFDEQFLLDVKKKKRKEGGKEGGEEGESTNEVVGPIKAGRSTAAGKEASHGKWVCGKCTNLNYASRTECNRCQASKTGPDSSATRIAATSKPVKAAAKTTAKNPADAGSGDGKWVCNKCNNLNYASRADCNRCQAAKVGAVGYNHAISSTAVGKTKMGFSRASTRSTTSRPPSSAVSWSIKAPTEEEMEENSLLRQIGVLAESDPQLPEWLDLSEEERERARILLDRTKRKANKRSKLKAAVLQRKK